MYDVKETPTTYGVAILRADVKTVSPIRRPRDLVLPLDQSAPETVVLRVNSILTANPRAILRGNL